MVNCFEHNRMNNVQRATEMQNLVGAGNLLLSEANLAYYQSAHQNKEHNKEHNNEHNNEHNKEHQIIIDNNVYDKTYYII